MDDLKRTIYIRALELVQQHKTYICEALYLAFDEIVGLQAYCYAELEEYFPEFYSLADYKTWSKSGFSGVSARPWEKLEHNQVWWAISWQEPRIRILNCILNTY